MKEKKHIDRLFQEKLKNFEAKPDAAIWNKIEAQMRKDKDERKVIPIWWRYAGIAAGLLLLVTIGYSVLNNANDASSNTPPSEVVEIDDKNNSPNEDKILLNNKAEEKTEGLPNNNLVEEDKITRAQKGHSEQNEQPKVNAYQDDVSKAISKGNNAVVNSNNEKRGPSQTINNSLPNEDKANIALTKGVYNKEDFKNENAQTSSEKTKMSNAIANNIPQNLPEQPALDNTQKNNLENIEANSAVKEALAETTTTINEKEDPNNETTDEPKPLAMEVLANSEDAEEIDEKEEEVIDRWSVTPNVAPVYFNALGKGSSIHSQFNENSKSGEINIAYGVNASYAISKKLSIRSGINKVNVGYNTNNVVVFQSINTGINTINPNNNNNAINNIDMSSSTQDTSIISGEVLAREVPNVVASDAKTTLNQEISFIEVPLEMQYKLSDKKLDVNVIGGMSTMILDNNSLYTEINNERILVGEANNINSVSYSANIGLGLDYDVSRHVSINIEPSFKYQINTFNNTSGNFRPYIVGVTSGLKFKF